MSILSVSTEQLTSEFREIWKDGRELPQKCWVEHFHNDHTFIRAVFAKHFTSRGVDRMLKLRRVLQRQYGKETSVTVVIHMTDHDYDWFAAHRLFIHLQ